MTKFRPPVGKLGDHFAGINILEKNRATVYERWLTGIKELHKYMTTQYLNKGVHAVIYGVQTNSGAQYAVFVEDHFLVDVGVEDEQ